MTGPALPTIHEMYAQVTPRYPELRGEVAIITGSNSGIGQGTAIRLAAEGMRVVISGRREELVREMVASLSELGADAIGVPVDLATPEGADALVDATLDAYGRLDVLVNNAANLSRPEFVDVTRDQFDQTMATNVRAPFVLAYRAAEIMRESHGASSRSIVNISSIGGIRAHWRGIPYDVTKGALNSMTQAMALELAAHGIRVNAIAPGPILVSRGTMRTDEQLATWANRTPMRRLGTALDVGNVVAFLCSTDADYICGEIICVDGGTLAQISPKEAPV